MSSSTFNIFSWTRHEIGDEITLYDKETGDLIPATVVGKCEDDPRYQQVEPYPGKFINSGVDYYRVQIKGGK